MVKIGKKKPIPSPCLFKCVLDLEDQDRNTPIFPTGTVT